MKEQILPYRRFSSAERRDVRSRSSRANDSIMLEILRESGGVALALPDEQILGSLVDWAQHEGIFLSPEGAAATAAYDYLLATGFLKSTDRVVLFNTGGGLKYTDVTAEAMGLKRPDALS
jgi:threonine synthase